MTQRTLNITIHGNPATKKNSGQIFRAGGSERPFIMPSAVYRRYEKAAAKYCNPAAANIDYPVNVRCVYYMQTRRRVDLGNLLAATCDVLVKYRVLADDHSGIVVGHDGSRVLYDKDKPRAEITISQSPVGCNDDSVPQEQA